MKHADGPILVTGASGFAGSHLIDLLGPAGVPVVGWSYSDRHFSTGSTSEAVAWETVDILDRDAVARSIARHRPAIVYHCAGAAHVGRAWEHTEETFAVNVRGTSHLVDALSHAGVTARVLIPSSAMVYAPSHAPLTEVDPIRPVGPYGLSKLAQEMVARSPGADVYLARAFNHFGLRQAPTFVASAFARQIARIEAGLDAPEILVGNLHARRDLTDVRDTVRAYRLIAERGRSGEIYNVCSGHAVQIGALLDLMLVRAQVPIRITVDPARYRPDDRALVVGDASKIRGELGWTPEIPLDQTVGDLLTYWRHEISNSG